ncbi:wa-cup [Drosophila busckii]|uniref:Wa-cup n=1 Tax=Drosophila busckii TaxID=30019 RepID=A0A0M4ECF0_DROBS|nr:wa-cup [Drosophila busckii]
MTKFEDLAPPSAGVKPHVEPWRVIGWPADQLRAMFTDWGAFFARKQRMNSSMSYLDAALEMDPNDVNVLMRRSEIKRMQARAPKALIDCKKAKDILSWKKPNEFNPHVSLEICDALYESNRFEDTKRKLHNNLRQFSSLQARPVLKRLTAVNENFADTLSDDSWLSVHRLINKMAKDQARKSKESKPECDVLSILDEEEEFLVPLEIERRARLFKIYHQTYLDKCWVDVGFLKRLRKSPNLLPKESRESTPFLRRLTEQNYKTSRTFAKMLHTRCPLYSKFSMNYPNKELYQQHQQKNLFRIQYQTRRNMFKILRTIRQLIQNGQQTKLSEFVEEVMGNYVTIKTNRIMPWKFEFINEVYNYLGLARINEYKIPSDMKVLSGKQRLLALFKIPIELSNFANVKEDHILNIQRISTEDPKAERFKKLMARLEYRMRVAKHPIERSYLLHEAAQAHLDSHSFDTCCSLARKALDGELLNKTANC